MLGVLIHNFVKLDGINRKADGKVNLLKYLSIERFSILISICVIVVLLLVKEEIKQLENAGNLLGLGFVTAGYMAQSIVVSFMGKAQKYVDTKKDDETI